MSIDYNQLRVTVDLDAVVHNYHLLASAASGELMPVVKSDAYGHGILQVSRALVAAGAGTLCAGLARESADLADAVDADVLCLLGPLGPADADLLARAGVVSVACHPGQLSWLEQAGRDRGKKVRVAVKFDTGMGRLGFAPARAEEVADRCLASGHLECVLLMSHLACADDPDASDHVRRQTEALESVRRVFKGRGLDVPVSLANSAAILAHPRTHFDLCRPGISLYGGNPFYGTPRAELGGRLRQAMSVRAPVVQVHPLAAGACVSYGCTFTAPRDMTVAVIGAGYADNYSRSLSGKARVAARGRRLPVLGRVCMQLTAVDPGNVSLAPGDFVTLLGAEGEASITADEMASWWGSISYEVFCLLGQNPRTHENGP
jgi:alanine racemase